MAAYYFNSTTQEAEERGSLSLRSVCSTRQIPGQKEKQKKKKDPVKCFGNFAYQHLEVLSPCPKLQIIHHIAISQFTSTSFTYGSLPYTLNKISTYSNFKKQSSLYMKQKFYS